MRIGLTQCALPRAYFPTFGNGCNRVRIFSGTACGCVSYDSSGGETVWGILPVIGITLTVRPLTVGVEITKVVYLLGQGEGLAKVFRC
jgi:hypothetical protein